MFNTNKKVKIFDSCLESNTDEVKLPLVNSASKQLKEPKTETITTHNSRLIVTTPDQRNFPDGPRNPSDEQRNPSENAVTTSVSDEVSGEDLTNRLSVVEGMNADNINVERGTKKSFDLNDLFKTKTEMINSSNDQRNSSKGSENSSDGPRNLECPVRISVSVDVSDGQLTKRLNVIEELITEKRTNKSVNDRLGSLEIEVGIIACMLLLILIILLVFIVGVLTILFLFYQQALAT